MSIMQISTVVFFASLLGTAGCGDQALDSPDDNSDPHMALQSGPPGIITGNGAVVLTPELITLYTPLGKLLTGLSLSVANIEANDLITSVGGRTFLHYAVKCALPAGQSLVTNFLGVQHTFEGKVGIAPEWATSSLTVTSQRWLSACILAHVNAFATSVPILMAGNHPALAGSSGVDGETFTLREGAFYGNIFGLLPKTYACTGEGSVSTRVCAEGGLLGLSACLFTVPGDCRASTGSVCASDVDGTYRDCQSTQILPLLPSTKYAETITVYLQP